MNKSCFALLLALNALTVLAQDATHTSTLTLSAGGQPYSYNHFDEHGGPAVGGRYEYRLWKHFALETGVDTLLPETHTAFVIPVISSGQTLVGAGPGCTTCIILPVAQRTRVTIAPFGARGILPLANGRLELFLGAGGAYAWHADYGRLINALLAQGSLGGRFALDQKRHYWVGSSVRLYTTGYSNYGANRQTWLSWTADIGFRFGR